MTTDALPTRRSNAERRKKRKKLTITGVIGEILITLGVVVLLYVVWQLWIGDAIVDSQSRAQASQQSQTWANTAKEEPFTQELSPKESPYNTLTSDPPAMAQPAPGEVFAQIYIPRLFGTDGFSIAGSVDPAQSLNLGMLGHYDGNAMPGADGNFAIAGHRSGPWGAPLKDMPALKIGDAIVIETKDGWYTYRYRTMEYVWPNETEVLLPTPKNAAAGVTGKYITLTTCSPRWGIAERLIAYGEFEAFTPRTTDGKMPESLQPAGN